MKVPWKKSEFTLLMNMLQERCSNKKIAEALGRTEWADHENYRKHPELKRRAPNKKKSPATSGNATEQEQKVEAPSAKDYNTEPEKSQAHWRVTYTCTACGWSIDRKFDMPFCPNCGAEMEGKEIEQ